MTTSEMSPADFAAVSGNNDGFGGNGSWLWLIVLIALFGGWGGNGLGVRNGVTDGYILNSDFAQVESKLDSVNNGICSLGYDQLAQMNGINQNVSNVGFAIQNAITQDTIANMQNTNAIGGQITSLSNQLAQCCCDNRQQLSDLKYTIATEDCATRQAIADGTRQILERPTNDKIETLTNENNALRLSASQQCQNNYLINTLRPTPIPSYPVQNPYGFYGFGYGTTIA